MCEPTTLLAASLVISAAAATSSYVGQQQAAKAQSAYNAQTSSDGAKLAQQSYEIQTQQELLQGRQEAEAAALKTNQIQTGAAKARATAQVGAAESGVGGVALQELYNDFNSQESLSKESVDTNLAYSREQEQTNLLGIQAGGDQRLASLIRPPVVGPSLLNAGLSFTGQALGAAGSYNQNQYQRNKDNSGRVL